MLPLERQKLLKQTLERVPDWVTKDNILLVGLRGSDAHGTKIAKGPNDIDDVDVFVVMIHPKEYYFGLDGYNKKHEHWDTATEDLDILVYDVRKFVHLLVGSNPNVLNWLFNRPEDYLYISAFGRALIDNKYSFMSKEIFPRLFGYAYVQLKDMQKEDKKYKGYMGEKRKKIVDDYGYDLKNAAHCVRLLLTGIELAQFGTFETYRNKHDIKIITDIKKGNYKLEDVVLLAEGLMEQFDKVAANSRLQDAVDKEYVSKLLANLIDNYFWQQETAHNLMIS